MSKKFQVAFSKRWEVIDETGRRVGTNTYATRDEAVEALEIIEAQQDD